MKRQTLIISGRLPGWNELDKGHWAERAKLKKNAMEMIEWEIKRQKIRPVTSKAEIKIICYEPTLKRDPSNVRAGAEKIILDALQNAGIVQNDNWAWLKDTPAEVSLDRKDPRVEIRIESDGMT